ncbi:MAG: decaprenyl-phosphate phosphoribosyltransferase [Candidatus Aminicenantales bacterium]
MKYLIYSLRPKNWIKNSFVFLPLIFGKKLFCFPENIYSLFAFIIFCMASSGVYLFNDIIDKDNDKEHPLKRERPLAAGKISVKLAVFSSLTLSIVSLFLSFLLSPPFSLVITTYLILNLVYSKYLKNMIIIDVFCLGGFFLLRIIGGSIIAEVELSHWIIFMTILLALFLGFNKRRQEAKLLEWNNKSPQKIITKYNHNFIDQIITILTSSIVIAYMLYTVDERTFKEFGTRNFIYTIPFVYYGLFRYLYLIINKDTENGDPTNILFSDRVLQINILLWIIVCFIVIYL